LSNIAFYLNDVELPHSASSLLHTADRVSITFISQKNGRKNNTITQWKTFDNILCPVIQWAAIVHRISHYTGATPDTPVSAVWTHGRLEHVTGKIVEAALGDGVVALGEPKLRIRRHEVGTHSIRSGSAMAMYLGGVPVFAIMLIGRWSSTAFMTYIRKQIEEFTLNVSASMLTIRNFRHAPTSSHGQQGNEYGGSATLMLGSNVA
jgi:hypothetical protein